MSVGRRHRGRRASRRGPAGPRSGVRLEDLLRALRESPIRVPGGHLQLRGVATSFGPATVAALGSHGGYQVTDGPYTMMALDLAPLEDEADFFHAPGTMTYLVVSENGRAVSTGGILVVDGVANIWSVATLPAARGRGAATAIIRAACAEARRQGARVAALRTSEDLARKDGLYERVGFEVVGHEHVWNLDGS